MNKQTLGEAMPIINPNTYPQSRRRVGHLASEIIVKIFERPEISLGEIAEELHCSHENVRKTYREVEKNPRFYATMAGCNYVSLSDLLNERANKKSLTRQNKTPWRGKADWPAKKVATDLGVGGRDRIALYVYKHTIDEV